MKIKSSTQLKDLVRNLAREKGVEPATLLTKFMMERLLERVSCSRYQSSFILKGGMLVAAFMGAEHRTTMDMDTTIKGFSISVSEVTRVMKEIISIDLGDNIKFDIKSVSEIMEETEYGGIRLNLDAMYEKTRIPLKIDISTGDMITPKEIIFSYKLMFEDRTIPVLSYPIETVLAEKLETILVRKTENTRMRDYYDVHVLLLHQDVVVSTLQKAILNTARQRGTLSAIKAARNTLALIKESGDLQVLWAAYQKKFAYATKYSWEDILQSVTKLVVIAAMPETME